MFPLGLLHKALQQAIDDDALVTDEASAIERYGIQPRMVEGQPGNIKITHPGDLQLAELFLSQNQS
jgi:2-C-methyl-D-erythritol 4-phosphate cytidylyltransferase